MKKKISLFLILILALILFSGCIEKKQPVSYEKENLIINISDLPRDLLLFDNSNLSELNFLDTVFQGLVEMDELGNIQPGISDRWEISEDELCYKFHIREDSKWSSGDAITADDFVEFFRSFLSTSENNPYKEQLKCIFGVTEYLSGNGDINNIAIKANGNFLEIRLNYKYNYLLQTLSQPVFSLRRNFDYLKKYSECYQQIDYTGAYKIETLKNNKAILTINPYYYNNKNVEVEKVVFTIEDNGEFALANLESNAEMDVVTNPPISEFHRLIDDSVLNKKELNKVSTFLYSTNGAIGLFFNLNKEGIVRDKNFRRAISLSLDRKYIVSELGEYIGEASFRLFPTDKAEKEEDMMLIETSSDLESACECLKLSTYDGTEKIKLIAEDTTLNKHLIKLLVAAMKKLQYTDSENKTVKLKVDYELLNKEELDEAIKEKDYNILVGEYYSGFNNGLDLLDKWTSDSRFNIWGYKSIDFDYLLSKARLENNKITEEKLIKKAEKYIIEELPIIPIYYKNSVICTRNNIKGLEVDSQGNISIEKLKIEDKK